MQLQSLEDNLSHSLSNNMVERKLPQSVAEIATHVRKVAHYNIERNKTISTFLPIAVTFPPKLTQDIIANLFAVLSQGYIYNPTDKSEKGKKVNALVVQQVVQRVYGKNTPDAKDILYVHQILLDTYYAGVRKEIVYPVPMGKPASLPGESTTTAATTGATTDPVIPPPPAGDATCQTPLPDNCSQKGLCGDSTFDKAVCHVYSNRAVYGFGFLAIVAGTIYAVTRD